MPRPALVVAVCAVLLCACRPDPSRQLLERYCTEVETSRLTVEAQVDLALLALKLVGENSAALAAAPEQDPATTGMLWTRGMACAQAAQAWGTAAGQSTALQQDWYQVRQVANAPAIDPPAPLATPPEVEAACSPPDKLLPTWAEATSGALTRVQAALAKATAERTRWVTGRDAALARCQAAGWKSPRADAGAR